MWQIPKGEHLPSRGLASTARLFSAQAFAQIRQAHVVVIGLGGVGSWAAEALARSGVGCLTLVDEDHVAESNLNRQVQATRETLGMAKVEALAARLRLVAPQTEVLCRDMFLTPENSPSLVAQTKAAFYLDACDDPRAKLALILALGSKLSASRLVVCGAAGGKCDPTRVMQADLSVSVQDPLLSRIRYQLRREHGRPRKGSLRVPVVFSSEPMIRPPPDPFKTEGGPPRGLPGAPLACAGYGSMVMVTATMGMVAAAYAIKRLAAA